MHLALRILRFLRLVDEDRTSLSLSSILMIVIGVKLALAPEMSLGSLGALVATLLLYAQKSYLGHVSDLADRTSAAVTTEIENRLARVENSRPLPPRK